MASSGSTIAPIFLRVALGLTFLWAGWNKVFNTTEVKGQAAATLANLGVITPASNSSPTLNPSTPAATPTPITQPTPTPLAPSLSSPPITLPVPTTIPTPAPTPTPTPTPTKPASIPVLNSHPLFFDQPRFITASFSTSAQTPGAMTYTASDFPEPIKVRTLYGLSLLLKKAANPLPNETGKTPIALWPKAADQGRWPVYFAWFAAMTELVGGSFLLLGFLVRVNAFLLAGAMLNALWLTEIGPAIQTGTAKFGFLPAYDFWATDAAGSFSYAKPLWILMLICASFSLVVLGAGGLSIDRLFTGSGRGSGRISKDDHV